MYDFETIKGHLPRRTFRSATGKPLLSWRVALLPFLGHEELHRQFRSNESWDCDHNQKLIAQMPAAYAVDPGDGPATSKSTGKTRVVMPVIDGGLWGHVRESPPTIKQVTDGTACTIGLLVAPLKFSVIWTKPDDYSMNVPPDMFGSRDFCYVLTLDGARYRIPRHLSKKDLQSLLTYNASDIVDFNKIYPPQQDVDREPKKYGPLFEFLAIIDEGELRCSITESEPGPSQEQARSQRRCSDVALSIPPVLRPSRRRTPTDT